MTFDVATISEQEIREQAEYPGRRMRVKAAIGDHSITVGRDISTDRQVALVPIAEMMAGCGALAQTEVGGPAPHGGIEDISEANLDAQMVKVTALLAPVFQQGLTARWRRCLTSRRTGPPSV